MTAAQFQRFLQQAFACYRAIAKTCASLFVCHSTSWQRESTFCQERKPATNAFIPPRSGRTVHGENYPIGLNVVVFAVLIELPGMGYLLEWDIYYW